MARKSRKQNIFQLESNEQNSVDIIDIEMVKPKRVFIYTRISSVEDKKNTTSIENQVNICKQYVEDFNNKSEEKARFEIVDVFMDNGFTGANMNRPSFIQMVDLIKKGNIDVLIVKDLSRIGRDYIGVGEFINNLVYEYGVELIAVTDNFFSSKIEDRNELIMLAFKNIMNDFFREDTRRKTIRSIKQELEQGIYRGSNIYGYDRCKKTKKFVVNVDEAIVVKKIFEMRLAGDTLQKIADELNDLKVETCYGNSMWIVSTIANILDNEMYTGSLIIGKTSKLVEQYTIDNNHEPIISKELFEKINIDYKGTFETYGYRLVGKKYYIRPKEAEIVKEIFNYRLDGFSTKEIAEMLNSKDVLLKNVKWTFNKINIILKNEIYMKKLYDENNKLVDPIISKKIFGGVRSMVENIKRPYGFHIENNELLPIEEELVVVKKVYEARSKGLSYTEIYNLIKENENPDVKPITTDIIISILASSTYEKYERENNIEIMPKELYKKTNDLSFSQYIPYGYVKVDNEIIIDEEESKIVKLIFDLRVKKLSINKILTYLIENNIKAPTNKECWKAYDINKIIENKAYIGEFKENYYLRNCIFPKKHIVDHEIYYTVNKKLGGGKCIG